MALKINLITPVIKKEAQKLTRLSKTSYARLKTQVHNPLQTSILTKNGDPTRVGMAVDEISYWVSRGIKKIKAGKRFVKDPVGSIEYKIIKKNILRECIKETDKSLEKIDRIINPINENNIKGYKGKLNSYIENNPRLVSKKLASQLLSENNPYNFFSLLKNKVVPKLDRDALYSFMETFTPKSKTIDVLRIEAEVRNLGIKNVNFSDDYDYAQFVKKAVEDLKQTPKIKQAKSIIVSPFIAKRYGGYCYYVEDGYNICLERFSFTALSSNVNAQIVFHVKKTKCFNEAPDKIKDKILKIKYLTNKSTNSDAHIFLHEVGHSFQNDKTATRKELKIAKKVSAVTNTYRSGEEIVPEFFAKLMTGGELTEEQMAIYLRLGGIIPKNSKQNIMCRNIAEI